MTDGRPKHHPCASVAPSAPRSWDDPEGDAGLGDDLERTITDVPSWAVTDSVQLQDLACTLQKTQEQLSAVLARETQVLEAARAHGVKIVRTAQARERRLRDELEALRGTCVALMTEKLELVATVDELFRARVHGSGPAPMGSQTGRPAAPAPLAPFAASPAPVPRRPHPSARAGFESAFGTPSLLELADDAPDSRDARVARQLRSSWFSAPTLIAFAVVIAAGIFMVYSAKHELTHGVTSRIEVPVHQTYGTPSRFGAGSGRF